MVLQEFDLTTTLNKENMIQYFQESLRAFIRAQLDIRGRELDSWEEAVEKAINAKAKTLVQSSSSTREIDSKCSQENKPAKKEKDFRRTKSTNIPSIDISSSKH